MTRIARPINLPARDGTYILGPPTSARRSIYEVSERRGDEVAVRLVGLLCQLGVALVREQVLPGLTSMRSAEPLVPFDMRPAILADAIAVQDLVDGDVFSLDNGSTWHAFAEAGFGTVSVYMDDRRDDDALCVRIEADDEQECLVLLDAPCLYDADSNDVVCEQAAKHLVEYRNGSYGPFVAPVCSTHLRAMRGRVRLGSGEDIKTIDLSSSN